MTFTYTCTYCMVALLSAAIGLVVVTHLTFDMGSESEIKTFRAFIICFIVFCITNSVWIWINYGYLDLDGTTNSISNQIAICLCSYFWFFFVSLKIMPRVTEMITFRMATLAPFLLTSVVILTTPYTKFVFYYTENNEFMHGPLYPMMMILAFLYLTVASVQLIASYRKTNVKSLKQEYLVLALFLLFPLLGGIIDVFVPNLPIMELSVMTGFIIAFSNLQGARIYNDTLTGLNNRRRAEQFLEELKQNPSGDKTILFFIGDADKFKEINDTYGHLEGDKALKTIADVLRNVAVHNNCLVARWGGDEFVIISDGESIDDPEKLIRDINDKLAERSRYEGDPYVIALSIGYAKWTSADLTNAALLAAADRMMCEKKRTRSARYNV